MAERASGYTSQRLGAGERLRELGRLVSAHRHPDHDVEAVASTLERARDRMESELTRPLEGLTILDVGSGQRQIGARVFGVDNTGIAVDAEVIHRRLGPRAISSVTRHEGPVRAAKTVGRRVLGFDRRFESGLCTRLQLPALGHAHPACMDALSMGIREGSVDVCFSRCLFEHLRDPRRAALELARVLRPGGLLYIVTNPFTGPLGAHDPVVMSRATPMDWAHLKDDPGRPWTSNAYLNRWTVDEYMDMFTDALPGCTVELWWPSDPELEDRLRTLREDGELSQFSDAELLAREVIAIWRKEPPDDAEAS